MKSNNLVKLNKELMNLNTIKLLIFDLDGTLVNSQFDITDGINHALTSMNRTPLSEEHVQRLVGGGVKKLVELAYSNTSDEIVLAQALKLFNEYYHNNLTTKTKPYNGILDVLKHFSKLKKAVYSNKPHPLTTRVINQLDLDCFFDIIIGSDHSKYKPKPSSEGVEIILKSLNTLPEHTLFIGDSTHDIHAGQEAGVLTCAVTYGYRDEKILANENPDFLINTPTDLIKLFNG